MELNDPDHLFDLDTVRENPDEVYKVGKVRKTIISVTKPVLRESTVCLLKEDYVRYEEVHTPEESPVKFNIIKACATQDQLSGHSPCMPSLRLEMLEREYEEPIRDRDKDWILHSQRPIFNEKGKDLVAPKFEVPLGKYRKIETVSKQFWAKEYQTMLRECLLMRQAAIISDTNCIVEIFGVGFTGRLFSDGATSPKLLVIEVYSIWNSQKYMLVLTVMELRLLLADHPDYLKPGRRADLLKFLLKALYFEYTITIPAREDPNHPTKPAHQPANVEKGKKRRGNKRDHHSHDGHTAEHAAHPHPTKQERAEFRLHLQRELAHQHDHALSDIQVENIIPINTHHDASSHIEVHIDHTVPHLQIHFEAEPGTAAADPAHPPHPPHSHEPPHYLTGTAAHPASPRRASVAAHGHDGPAAAAHHHHVEHHPRHQSHASAHAHASHTAHSPHPEHAVGDGVLHEEPHEALSEPAAAASSDSGEIVNPTTEDAAAPVAANGEVPETDSSRKPAEGTEEPSKDTAAAENNGDHANKEHEHANAPAEPPVDPFSKPQVQTVVHLDPPVMPKGYPTTVEQMIRVPPVLPEGSQDPVPIVTQQLHIGAYRRINGPILRKQQAIERRIAQEKEEARLRAIWLATPKRRRNLKGIRLIRRCNYMVLLTGYYDPLRPNTILLYGMVSHEATRMTMYLGLGKIRDMLRIETSVQTWSSDELKEYVTKVLRFGGVVKTDSSNGYAINVQQLTGLETALVLPHTVVEFLCAVRGRQRPLRSARWCDPDSLSASYVPVLDVENEPLTPDPAANFGFNIAEAGNTRPTTSAEPAPTTTAAFAAAPATDADPSTETRPGTALTTASAETASTFQPASTRPGTASFFPAVDTSMFAASSSSALPPRRPGWTSLGGRGSSRAVGYSLGAMLRPWREIGKPLRLSSGGVRVQHVYCTYCLYADTSNMRNFRKPIPTWPVHDPEAAARMAEAAAALAAEEASLAASAESDDDDFLKAGSESDEDSSDDDNTSHSKRKNANKKKKKKKSSRNKRNSQAGDDESGLFGEEGGEENLVDQQNETYAEMGVGLVLQLMVYLPSETQFQGMAIPAGSFKMTFTVDELDPIFPTAAEKERIARALRAVYFDFYDSATEGEVRQAEEDWTWLSRTLLKRARWAMRGGMSDHVATEVSNLQQSRLGIDLLQELFDANERLQYVQSLLFSNAVPVVDKPVEEKSLFSDGPSMKIVASNVSLKLGSLVKKESPSEADMKLVVEDAPLHVTLSWPCTIWTRAMKVRSAVSERGEYVRMQVTVFQKGEGHGVICFDCERHDVYFAQHPDEGLQLSQIQGFRFSDPHEKNLQLFLFLTAGLTYAETVGQDGVKRGKVTFGSVDEEPAVLDVADVVEGDYTNTTESLLNNAANKAQARMKRKK